MKLRFFMNNTGTRIFILEERLSMVSCEPYYNWTHDNGYYYIATDMLDILWLIQQYNCVELE